MAESIPQTIRRFDAICKRVLKSFPDGLLSEERDARPNTPWPWERNFSQLDSHGRISGDLWSAIASFECRIARSLLQGEKSDERTAVVGELSVWLEKRLTEGGLLAPAPWQTHLVLPPLYRLRIALTGDAWNESLETCYHRLVAAVLQTSSSQTWLFESGGPSPGYVTMLERIVAEPPLKSWRDVPAMLWSKRPAGKRPAPPSLGIQSDDAEVAVLRRGWAADDAIVGVDYRQGMPNLELWLLQERILAGAWETHCRVDGDIVPLRGKWRATCWFADGDGEYLELRLKAGGGLMLDRQLYLPRKAPMLWMSDTLSSRGVGSLELEWELPAPGSTGLEGSLPTRAQMLKGPASFVRLLPVGFPANPMAIAPGRMSVADGKLRLSNRTTGERLFLPLVVSWSRERPEPQAEWRQLTVTNDRRRVPADEAVGFRVPVDDREVIFFRALRAKARYAFVGYQTFNELVIGHLQPDGELAEWLLIE